MLKKTDWKCRKLSEVERIRAIRQGVWRRASVGPVFCCRKLRLGKII